jgi:hypothetical protein
MAVDLHGGAKRQMKKKEGEGVVASLRQWGIEGT